MTDLIERLEKATGPDRNLDAEIAASVRYHPYGENHWVGGSDIEIRATGYCVQAFRATGESCGNWQPPLYTESIDAALRLLRTGWRAQVDTLNWVEVMPIAIGIYRDHRNEIPVHVRHDKQPALALCIACMKSRALV